MAAWLSVSKKRTLRKALIARQGLICFYCREELIEPEKGLRKPVERASKRYATIDHIRPISMGGSNQISNLVLACVQCHQERHN